MLGLGRLGSGSSPRLKIPAPRGSPAKQRWQLPHLPRFQGSCSFRILQLGDLAGCRGLSRRLMRLKEAPGEGRVSSNGALQSNGGETQASALVADWAHSRFTTTVLLLCETLWSRMQGAASLVGVEG